MILTNFYDKPSIISDGQRLKGRQRVWVNFGIKEHASNEDNQESNWEAYNECVVMPELTLEAFLDAISQDMLAKMEQEEAEAIMEFFDGLQDAGKWAALRKAQVTAYDQSSYVNRFIVNGNEGWLDKSTRVGLVNLYSMYGDDEAVPSMWMNGIEMAMENKAEAMSILAAVEKYAAQCFAQTQRALQEIETAEAEGNWCGIKHYDFRLFYPAELKIGD